MNPIDPNESVDMRFCLFKTALLFLLSSAKQMSGIPSWCSPVIPSSLWVVLRLDCIQMEQEGREGTLTSDTESS